MGNKSPKRFIFILIIILIASFIFVKGQSAPYPGHVGPEICSTEFCVTTGGKVGIGTTNPQEALDVLGNVDIEGNVMTTGTITAAGDICTTIIGEPYGSLCVGKGIDVAASTSVIGYPQKICSPASDCSDTGEDDTDSGSTETGTQYVDCGYSMIPLSCGGFAKVEGGGSLKRLVQFGISPYYGTGSSLDPSESSGCEINYIGRTSDLENAKIIYNVEAYCVKFNLPS